MPKPNFNMLVKIQLGETSRNSSHAVKTPRGANREELILIARGATDQTDSWGVSTAPLSSGENVWLYTPLSYKEVCHHPKVRLH